MVLQMQKERAESFLKYHHDRELLVLLNSWDAGSSRLIEACGFKAIATTSMGIAASMGYPDCQVITLPEMLHAVTGIVNAVRVPVTVWITERANAEEDQHRADGELEERGQQTWELDAQEDERARDEEEHRRMTEAPARSVENAAAR